MTLKDMLELCAPYANEYKWMEHFQFINIKLETDNTLTIQCSNEYFSITIQIQNYENVHKIKPDLYFIPVLQCKELIKDIKNYKDIDLNAFKSTNDTYYIFTNTINSINNRLCDLTNNTNCYNKPLNFNIKYINIISKTCITLQKLLKNNKVTYSDSVKIICDLTYKHIKICCDNIEINILCASKE